MDYRLPTSVVPSRYELRLVPDLDAATFAGEETVTVTIREPVSEITLNAAELAIQSVSARDAAGAVVEGTATLDQAQERARLVFPTPLAPGEWRLTLAFTGVLNDRLHGFYRSTYKDPAGATHTMIRSGDRIVVERSHSFFREVITPTITLLGATAAIASVILYNRHR